MTMYPRNAKKQRVRDGIVGIVSRIAYYVTFMWLWHRVVRWLMPTDAEAAIYYCVPVWIQHRLRSATQWPGAGAMREIYNTIFIVAGLLYIVLIVRDITLVQYMLQLKTPKLLSQLKDVQYQSRTGRIYKADVYYPSDSIQRQASTNGRYNSNSHSNSNTIGGINVSGSSGKKRKTLPTVVFVHGGAWCLTTRQVYRPLALALASRGMIVCVPDYTQWPHGDIVDMVHDIGSFLTTISPRLVRMGGSPNSITLIGHSSGAHVASLYGLQHPCVKSTMVGSGGSTVNGGGSGHHGSTLYPKVSSLILISGVYDIHRHLAHETSRGVAEVSPMVAVNQGFDRMHRFDVCKLVRVANKNGETDDWPRIMFIHGDKDTTVPLSQATVLYATMRERQVPCDMKIIIGMGHADPITRIMKAYLWRECHAELTVYNEALENEQRWLQDGFSDTVLPFALENPVSASSSLGRVGSSTNNNTSSGRARASSFLKLDAWFNVHDGSNQEDNEIFLAREVGDPISKFIKIQNQRATNPRPAVVAI